MVSLLVCVIVAAIIFDYINGFHDAANAIATVVSTGVLPVRTAVMLAGILNFTNGRGWVISGEHPERNDSQVKEELDEPEMSTIP